MLCQALEVNKRLTHLKIAANGLGEAFGKSMSAMLTINSSLKSINVVSNEIGMKGGKQIQEGIAQNATIVEMDLRLTGVGPDAEEAISAKLQKNKDENTK